MVTGRDRPDVQFSFTLETGTELLALSFQDVTMRDTVQVMRVPDPEPVIAYVASFGPEHVGVAPGAQWDDFLARVSGQVHAIVDGKGGFPVTYHACHFRSR